MFIYDGRDPFVAPNYRWERARHLIENGRYGRRKYDDVYTQVARKFQLAEARCRDLVDQERLARKMPGIWHAYQIWSRRDTEHDECYTIEARLLANQSFEEIADRQMTQPEVVFWFHQLFFDVQGRLRHKDWLANRVLGPAAHRGIMERDYDLLLKLMAMAGGPMAVDLLVDMHVSRQGLPKSVEEVRAFLADFANDNLRLKAAIAARCMPANLHNHLLIVEAYQRLQDMEQRNQQSSTTTNLLVSNLAEMVSSIGFKTGSQVEQPEQADIAVYDHTNLELRSQDLLNLAAGKEPEQIEWAKDFRIPDLETAHAATTAQ